MKRISRKIVTATVLMAFLVVFGSALYMAYLLLNPESLNKSLERKIQGYFGGTVSIGRTSVDVLRGPLFVLSDIKIENEEMGYLRAGSLTAKVSPWYLLIGRVKMTHVGLSEPDVSIKMDALEGVRPGKIIGVPFVDVMDGSARVLYRDLDFEFKEVNGFINEEEISIEAHALGGTAHIGARHHPPDGWKGGLEIEGLMLSKMNSETGGIARIVSSFDLGEDASAASVEIEANDVSLPWTEENLETITVTVNAKGREDTLALQAIEIKTPLLEFNGEGRISGLEGIKNVEKALLEIEMESKEFDYEKVVQMLPVEYFPEWLSLLLTRQIRGEKSRFSAIRYRGSVGDMADGEAFVQNFYAALDLMGQSFGACHGPERIEGVTGWVVAEKGNIILRDLSGRAGGSRLESVNITFKDVIKPEEKVLVDVKLDMDARDFLYAWRAAIVPESAHGLLLPVSDIEEGRIRGQIRMYSDSESAEPVRTEGEIVFDDCTFRWDEESFRHMSGSVKKEDFDSPMKLELSGKVNDLSFAKLDLEMEDPFANVPYRFSAYLRDVFDNKTFSFDEDADIAVSGTGTGSQMEGKLTIASKGFDIFGTHYRPFEGGVKGEGVIAGKVFSGRKLDITGLRLEMEPGSLFMDYGMDEDAGSLKIKGALDLDRMEAEIRGDYCLLSGKVRGDADISWSHGAVSSLSGFMDCEDAKLCYKDSFLNINGPVKLGNRRITTDRLSIGYGDMQMDISGILFMDRQPHFTGALAIDGVRIDEKEESITKELEGLSADATLKLTNMKYHGIPIDDASAKLTLEDGRLNLDKMVVHALSGVAEGKASIEDKGGTDLDVNLDFTDTDLGEFLDAISPGEAKISGTMKLKGRLWGNTDAINGDLVFRAKDGAIAKYYLISKMFTVLNVYKIVRNKKIDLLSEGFSYDRIKSSFAIRKGVMKFDDFYFASDSVQMSVVGEYSIRKRKVNAVAGVQPLETLDRIVSSVPVLGWVMTGEDKKLLVVMLKIQGDIENPTVVPQTVNTLSNSVKGIVLRSLQLPSELITNPENVIK
jgi:hypothetical protein